MVIMSLKLAYFDTSVFMSLGANEEPFEFIVYKCKIVDF